jgi:hypothetical protein
MHTAIFSIIAILSLLLGGGGITVAAAQAALPDDALYSIKTWSEDFRFSLADTDEDKLDLSLQFASHRMKEIKIRLEHGVVPEQALARKYQAEIETALQLATGLDTVDAQEALAKVSRVLMDQQLIIQQIQTRWQAQTQARNNGEETQLMNQFMTQTQMLLQYSLQYARQGMQEPEFLQQQQQQFQFSFQFGTQVDSEPGNPWAEETPSNEGNGIGGSANSNDNGNGNGK